MTSEESEALIKRLNQEISNINSALLLILKAIGDQHVLILQLKAWQSAHLTVLRDSLASDDAHAEKLAQRATQILHADFQKFCDQFEEYNKTHDIKKFVQSLLQNDPDNHSSSGPNLN